MGYKNFGCILMALVLCCVFHPAANAWEGFQLRVNDVSGLDEPWPMVGGLPFPEGELDDASLIRIVDAEGNEVPAQIDVVATWRDGSTKQSYDDTVRDIGSRLELFVDDFLIEELKGAAERRLHHPSPREVVLELEKPWEGSLAYPTVIQDGGRIRFYYSARPGRPRGETEC